MMPFKRRKQPEPQKKISQRVNFPYGLFVEVDGNYFHIRKGLRARIPTKRIFDSWNAQSISVTPEAVAHIPVGGKMGYRDGSLICDFSDGKIYLISENKRRLITSPDVFDLYGLDKGKMIWASADEVNIQKEGEPLGGI